MRPEPARSRREHRVAVLVACSRLRRMVRALGVLAALVLAGCASVPASSTPPSVAAAPPAATAPPTPAAAGPGELAPPIRQVLPNGLRLIMQDHRAADIVAVYLYVGVGVRYERPEQLGSSHFQEHMLFKGTDKWGPGYIDRTVEGVGGRTNASTSFDYTDFYIVVPTESLQVAVQTLADMAFRSTFDQKEVNRERDVIFEEANIDIDNAKSAIIRQLYGLVFADNPYGSPVLGTRETMNAATSETLKAYNRHYYTPENMTLVVVGPIEPAKVRAMVDGIFGSIPATGYKPVPAPAPRPLRGVTRQTVERPEQQSMLAMGWSAPRSDDPNGDAVDLVTTILAGSESSRLARRLRDQERLVNGISMSYSAQMGGGIVSLRAELEAKDLERVERIILEEIAKMQESGPTEEERQLAVTKFEAQHAFDTETSEGLANAYGSRRDDVDARRRAGLRRPPAQDHARADPRRRPPLPLAHRLRADRLRAEEAMTRPALAWLPPRRPAAGIAALALALLVAWPAAAEQGAVTRTRLGNGMIVLVRENLVAPVVAMSLMVKMGTRWETRETAGISNFLQIMMVRGTSSLDGTQIVETADRMGGSIDAYGDADFSEIAATALDRYWAEMLDLVADVALRPSLPDGTLRAVGDFLVRQIRNRGDKPYNVAFDTLLARTFGDQPYAWDPVGLKESLERTNRDALIAHYRRHYVPGGMVLAVSGKVKAAEVVARADRLFGALPTAPAPAPNSARAPAPAATRDALKVPGAQAQIVIGGLAPAMTDADFPALKVVSTVLGGGLAGRFFSELRDKQALAYTTAAQEPMRVEPGYFLALLGTAPDNAAKAEVALNEQLTRIKREPVNADELRVAQAYLLGNLAMDRRTNARQAWYLSSLEVAGVGYEYLDRYTAQVRAVTAADVQRVAQRYLSTLRTVVVEPPTR